MLRSGSFGISCVALVLAAFSVVGTASQDPVPTPEDLGHGVWLISGGIAPDREPDGNTIVFEVPQGLVVIDTGRHTWHREAILELARQRRRAIVDVVNTHWHLDHVSGNPALRAAFPLLRVYASDAIDSALTGFLANSLRENARYADDPNLPATLRDDIRADTLTIRHGATLKPDERVTVSGRLTLGGRPFDVHLSRNAATAGDVWLYDPHSDVAALGDLVTLPAPFLDTACPEGWQTALAQVQGISFRLAVPGHGSPMTPAQFRLYRAAFDAFIACARSPVAQGTCGTRWAADVGPLLAPDGHEAARATTMATNYVELLRANGGRSKYCEAPGSSSPSG